MGKAGVKLHAFITLVVVVQESNIVTFRGRIQREGVILQVTNTYGRMEIGLYHG